MQKSLGISGLSSVICSYIKRRISLECGCVRAEDSSFVSGADVCCRCHRESRRQEGGGIAQAWTTWSENASAPTGTVMCWECGVPEMVTPAIRTVQNDHNAAPGAKYEDTWPYKNFVSLTFHCVIFFAISAEITCYQLVTLCNRVLRYVSIQTIGYAGYLYNMSLWKVLSASQSKKQRVPRSDCFRIFWLVESRIIRQ